MDRGHIVDMVLSTGETTACSAGIFREAAGNNSGYSFKGKHTYTFGVDRAWFKNRGEAKSAEEADYHLWRNELERIFGIEIVKGHYWKMGPASYNQLVFVVSLLRQPLEAHNKYPFPYRKMVELGIDPMGTIVALSIDPAGAAKRQYDSYKGWFYNSYGHGIAQIADALEDRDMHNVQGWRRLSAIQCLPDIDTSNYSCGYAWKADRFVGLLEEPREYKVGQGTVITWPELQPTKEPNWYLPPPKAVPPPPAYVIPQRFIQPPRYQAVKPAVKRKKPARLPQRDAKGRFVKDNYVRRLYELMDEF
jgi:hypothetical protein